LRQQPWAATKAGTVTAGSHDLPFVIDGGSGASSVGRNTIQVTVEQVSGLSRVRANGIVIIGYHAADDHTGIVDGCCEGKGGEDVGEASACVTRFNTVGTAQPGDVPFPVENASYDVAGPVTPGLAIAAIVGSRRQQVTTASSADNVAVVVNAKSPAVLVVRDREGRDLGR
jgi:hypothetical protein